MTYAANATWTVGILRLFPGAIGPLAARCTPPLPKIENNVALARRASVLVIEKRIRAAEEHGQEYEELEDILQWIIDVAVDEKLSLTNLHIES